MCSDWLTISPFKAEKAEKFNPEDVPNVLELVNQIDKFTKENENLADVKAFKKTKMREPVQIFEEFLSNLSPTLKGKLIEKMGILKYKQSCDSKYETTEICIEIPKNIDLVEKLLSSVILIFSKDCWL